MKRKEMMQLVVAVVILAAAGFLIFSQLQPAKSSTGKAKVATIPKITPINPNYDSSTISYLNDPTKNRDFYQAPDLNSGLGNPQPFGSGSQQ